MKQGKKKPAAVSTTAAGVGGPSQMEPPATKVQVYPSTKQEKGQALVPNFKQSDPSMDRLLMERSIGVLIRSKGAGQIASTFALCGEFLASKTLAGTFSTAEFDRYQELLRQAFHLVLEKDGNGEARICP